MIQMNVIVIGAAAAGSNVRSNSAAPIYVNFHVARAGN